MNTWCSTGKTSASVGSGCVHVCVGTDVTVAERPCHLVAVCVCVCVCVCECVCVLVCACVRYWNILQYWQDASISYLNKFEGHSVSLIFVFVHLSLCDC